MWSLEEPYCDRGEVPEHFRAATSLCARRFVLLNSGRAAALKGLGPGCCRLSAAEAQKQRKPETGGGVFARPFIASNSDAHRHPNASGASRSRRPRVRPWRAQCSDVDWCAERCVRAARGHAPTLHRLTDCSSTRPTGGPDATTGYAKDKRRGPKTTPLIDPNQGFTTPISEDPCAGRSLILRQHRTYVWSGQTMSDLQRALTSA